MVMDRLMVAVRGQMGANNDEDFEQMMDDLARGGADAGWPGFGYTSDCVEFYDANESAIWELASQYVEEFGYESVPELVSHFARADMAANPDGFKNLLAWFALEEVARHISDGALVS